MLHFFRSYGLFFSITLGWFCPLLYPITEKYFAFFLMPMLFFTFVRIQAPLRAFHWSHLLMLLWNFGFPCVTFGILRTLGFSLDFAMAGFMAACTPTGTAAPVVMTFLDGKMEYVVLGLLLTTLTFTFAVPFLFPLFYGVETPGLSLMILRKVSGVVLIPMVLAVLCRWFYPKSQEWGKKMKDLTFGLWQILIVLICAQMSHSILQDRSVLYAVPQIFLISLTVCTLNFTVGRILGGKKYAAECSQTLGQKNCALTILVAIVYATPIVALGPSLYIVCHNTWNAMQIARHEKIQRSVIH